MRDPKQIIESVKSLRYEESLGVARDAPLSEVDKAVIVLSRKYGQNTEVRQAINKAAAQLRTERNKPRDRGMRYRRIGIDLSSRGREPDSIPYLEKAVELCGEGIDYHWLGTMLWHMAENEHGDLPEEVFQGRLVECWSHERLEEHKSRKARAIECLQEAVRIRGDGVDYHWLGTVLVLEGRNEDGIPYLRKAVETRGQKADYEWLGRALWDQGKFRPLLKYTVTAVRSLSGGSVLLQAAWSWRSVFFWLILFVALVMYGLMHH